MTGQKTREKLIETGRRALLTHGYDGVGIGAILAAADVPKGSFYHFFASKEAFVCAVLQAYWEQYRDNALPILEDASRSPKQRLEAYFDALRDELIQEDPLGGCLYGVLAQTLSIRGDQLRAEIRECFSTWQDRLQAVLAEAETAGDLAPGVTSRDGAAFLIEAYEGALIRMKADGNFAPYDRFKTYALTRLFR